MDTAVEYIKYYVWNFWRNLTGVFDDMDSRRWIRMIAAVGAYLLLRPLLVKLGEKIQNKQYAKTMESSQKGPKAKISPNALRGQVEPIQDEDEEEEEIKGVESGKKARKRQLKKAREEQQDEDSQADVMDHLVDYVEGEDGW